MPLTDPAVRNAKFKDKPYKLADEKGLYLLVNHAGRYWRVDYRFAGKRKTLALGVYPDTSLKDARNRRDDARKLLANDCDPGEAKKARRAAQSGADTFEAIAREWHAKRAATLAPATLEKNRWLLEDNLFP